MENARVIYPENLGTGDDEVPMIYSYGRRAALDELSYICPYKYVSCPSMADAEITCPANYLRTLPGWTWTKGMRTGLR